MLRGFIAQRPEGETNGGDAGLARCSLRAWNCWNGNLIHYAIGSGFH
jgi:hypothetical protein